MEPVPYGAAPAQSASEWGRPHMEPVPHGAAPAQIASEWGRPHIASRLCQNPGSECPTRGLKILLSGVGREPEIFKVGRLWYQSGTRVAADQRVHIAVAEMSLVAEAWAGSSLAPHPRVGAHSCAAPACPGCATEAGAVSP